MNELLRPRPEGIRAGEAMRSRVQVFVGPPGSFEEQKKAASAKGAETIDPLYAGVGPAVSSISPLNKRSTEYTVCTGLFAIGKGMDGKNVSFVTHQIPSSNPEFIETYKQKVRARFEDLLAQIDPKSIDVGFFGGEAEEIVEGSPDEGRQRSKNEWYSSMRELFARIARESAGVEMRVVDGPNRPGGRADVFLDTEGAKLYIEREE